MATSHDIAEAFQWSISQIARALGMDRKTVTRRLEDHNVKPAGMRKGYAVYELRDACPALYGQVENFVGSALSPDDMMPKDRKDWFQSENERLKFELATGHAVLASDMAREMAAMAKGVVSTLDSLPDLLERDCGLQPQDVEKVQNLVDVLRDQMYLRVMTDDE